MQFYIAEVVNSRIFALRKGRRFSGITSFEPNHEKRSKVRPVQVCKEVKKVSGLKIDKRMMSISRICTFAPIKGRNTKVCMRGDVPDDDIVIQIKFDIDRFRSFRSLRV